MNRFILGSMLLMTILLSGCQQAVYVPTVGEPYLVVFKEDIQKGIILNAGGVIVEEIPSSDAVVTILTSEQAEFLKQNESIANIERNPKEYVSDL